MLSLMTFLPLIGMCIILATNKLRVAAARMIKTAFIVIKSTGTIPLLNVWDTALPQKTAPNIAKKINKTPAFHLLTAMLPTAVENDPAKLGAPILREK